MKLTSVQTIGKGTQEDGRFNGYISCDFQQKGPGLDESKISISFHFST